VAARLGFAALVITIVLVPVFLPYWQSSRELGFARSTYEVQNWAAEWSFYGSVLQSNWLYGKVLAPAMASAGGERELFPGIVATLLALVGILRGRGRARFFYLVLGLVSLLLTFGLSKPLPGTSIDVPLPYAFLYDWVPGFKALRVPVRFDVLVDLAIYVLAGYGVAYLGLTTGRRFAGQWAKALVVVLISLVLLEFINPLDTGNRRDVTTQLRTTEPYGWLARAENSGPVVELPMTAGQDDVWYTFFDTRHWQPLVNGWGSFVAPGTVRLKQALDSFPDPFTVSLLQGLEIRHVVVHLWQFPGDAQADLKRRLDATPQLEQVDRAGDNYVYRLAPDPWLRRVAAQVGNGTLWVGEARHGTMPTLDPLAYSLARWGVPASNIGGNIDVGYKPLGSLPFGIAPDYALVPTTPGGDAVPFGFGLMQPVEGSRNAAALLLKRNPMQLKTYDLAAPGAPALATGDIRLGIGASGIAFDAQPPAGEGKGRRWASLSLLSFAPADITLRPGGRPDKKLHLPAGLTRYDTQVFDAPNNIEILNDGSVRLLRAELWQGENTSAGTPISGANWMPLEVTPSRSSSTLDARLRVVPPKGGGDFTATVDVYVEPWGTHPEGHFGSWSVVLPADGAGRDYAFHLDPIAKKVTTTRDGQPIETFAWIGPPTQGDFRASLSITRDNKMAANVPLSFFTLKGSRLTAWEIEPPSLSIVQP
jgi:hypothetical protein